jgi:hypothetical protein
VLVAEKEKGTGDLPVPFSFSEFLWNWVPLFGIQLQA